MKMIVLDDDDDDDDGGGGGGGGACPDPSCLSHSWRACPLLQDICGVEVDRGTATVCYGVRPRHDLSQRRHTAADRTLAVAWQGLGKWGGHCILTPAGV